MWEAVVYERQSKGWAEVRDVLLAVANANNTTMTRNGRRPEQTVFGGSLDWPSFNQDDDEVALAALGAEGAAQKALLLRTAARLADKLKRALLRQPPSGQLVKIVPRTRVYV